ncbi:MAG: hypothetical protein GY896_14105 [Gammaproteobacteria bacterium]|nr:hypothetical protein [Gammaproteobacteria bacterium]
MVDNNMALIIFNGVNLLLPQNAVVSIEIIQNEESITGAIGTLKLSEGDCPVFALDSDFKLKSECPPEYKYCVEIGQPGKVAFSILCEEVGSVAVEHESEFRPLRACMRSAANPIASLTYKDEKLMLVSDIESMQQFLNLGVAA